MGEEGEGGLGGGDVGGGFGEGEEGFEVLVGLGVGVRWGGGWEGGAGDLCVLLYIQSPVLYLRRP